MCYAKVAQSVEHANENRSVGGSIPPLGTIPYIKVKYFIACFNRSFTLYIVKVIDVAILTLFTLFHSSQRRIHGI